MTRGELRDDAISIMAHAIMWHDHDGAYVDVVSFRNYQHRATRAFDALDAAGFFGPDAADEEPMTSDMSILNLMTSNMWPYCLDLRGFPIVTCFLRAGSGEEILVWQSYVVLPQ